MTLVNRILPSRPIGSSAFHNASKLKTTRPCRRLYWAAHQAHRSRTTRTRLVRQGQDC